MRKKLYPLPDLSVRIVALPLALLAAPFATLAIATHITTKPIRRRALSRGIRKYWLPERRLAYLWFDQTSPAAEFIESTLLPQFGRHILVADLKTEDSEPTSPRQTKCCYQIERSYVPGHEDVVACLVCFATSGSLLSITTRSRTSHTRLDGPIEEFATQVEHCMAHHNIATEPRGTAKNITDPR